MRDSTRSLDYLLQGIKEGNKVVLGQAITLIESNRQEDRLVANQLIKAILPRTGNSIRIGISGVPGVGKSTFIDSFGKLITSQPKKVAVLAVDPSSAKTKGSILGDKTRMAELSRDPLALIRPTPTGLHLGGVASKTRETILLCEAAGYEVILIETVGVGQSETAVRDMTDFFLLLMLAGAGDELQGIKKGIIEMADAIVINKADGSNLPAVRQAQTDLQHALHYTEANEWGWQTKVMTCSAQERTGISPIWEMINLYKEQAISKGVFQNIRQQQNKKWMADYFDELLKDAIHTHIDPAQRQALEQNVANQLLSPTEAAQILFDHWMRQWMHRS
jgi:LAO/AO transport system kinase